MTQQVINVGSVPNDGTGDPIRTAYIKCNNNFSELYSRVQTDPPLTLVGSPGDEAGMTAYDEDFFYYCFANYDGSSVIWRTLSDATPVELANGTSNIVVTANSSIVFSVAGVSNVASFDSTTLNVNNIDAAGVIESAGNLTVGGSLNLAGDLVSGGNLIVNDTIQVSQLEVSGNVLTHSILPAANVTYDLGSPTAQFRDLYLSGNTLYLGGGTLTANATAMTLSTATGAEFVIGGSAGNATGAFGNLEVTNDATIGGNVSASYYIGDGSFLTNITAFSNVAATQIANGTSIITIPVVNGNAVLQAGGVQSLVVAPTGIAITGNINATGAVSVGAVTSGAISATGAVAATGNVSGANLTTTGVISATGNITGGNLVTTGILSAGSLSTGVITATGNISGGNLSLTGLASVTGNVTGGNVISNGAVIAAGNITAVGVSATNAIVTSSSAAATSTTTGSLRTAGGLGVAGNAYIGGLVEITGNLSAGNIFSANRANVAFLDIVSGIDVKASAESVSPTTGSIKTAGGLGVAGNVYVGQMIVATGNVTGGNLFTTGNAIVSGSLDVTGTIAGNVLNLTTATVTGNIDGGNLTVTGVMSGLSVSTASIVKTGANGVGNIGSSTNYYNTVFAKATSAQYADLAECYLSDQSYPPGTVVKFGGDKEVTLADQDHDPEIAGVVSTNPAYIMNAGLVGQHSVTVALAGRVPCRVRGPVRRGQMMVSAGDGRARAETNPAMGTVIGKALENFDGDEGVIEVVVGRL
jgi:hypothetical protein